MDPDIQVRVPAAVRELFLAPLAAPGTVERTVLELVGVCGDTAERNICGPPP